MPLKGEQLKIAMREYLDELRSGDQESITQRQKLMIELGDNFINMLLREERGRGQGPAQLPQQIISLLHHYGKVLENGDFAAMEK